MRLCAWGGVDRLYDIALCRALYSEIRFTLKTDYICPLARISLDPFPRPTLSRFSYSFILNRGEITIKRARRDTKSGNRIEWKRAALWYFAIATSLRTSHHIATYG